MASYIERGESVFFQFRDGKSVLNSQCKPRMFKTAEKATLGVHYIETDEIVEYAELKHGRWKHYHKQNIAVCTNCSFERKLDDDFGKAVSCPNCGADMRGE